MRETGAEEDVGHAVGHPFHPHVAVGVGALAHLVAEGGVYVIEESLAVRLGQRTALRVGVVYVASCLEESGRIVGLAVVPPEVCTGHGTGGDASASAPAWPAPAESVVVDIVPAQDKRELSVVEEAVDVGFGRVSVFGAIAHIHVGYPALLHILFHCEVKHSLLLAVIDAGDAGIVTLLVVCLYLLHHLGGQVLHGHLGVFLEELLTLYHHLRHRFAVDLDGSVVAHLCTG